MNIGDTVFAYWEPFSSYFIGTVVEYDGTQKGGAYLVVFEDGEWQLKE